MKTALYQTTEWTSLQLCLKVKKPIIPILKILTSFCFCPCILAIVHINSLETSSFLTEEIVNVEPSSVASSLKQE